MSELQKILHQVFLRSPTNLFDEFMVECQKWYERPAHSLTEMRSRDTKKIRGDIYEEFCVLYLKHVKGYKTVWRLEDVPDTVLETLKMKRRDMGIDLIVEHDGYKAVQCKYKKRTLRKCSVTWSALSTFYALCMRTGPWSSYIVMTTADYCSHQGEKTEKDQSFCIGSMRAITKEQWIQMCGLTGNLPVFEEKPSLEELRALRIARFGIQKEPIVSTP